MSLNKENGMDLLMKNRVTIDDKGGSAFTGNKHERITGIYIREENGSVVIEFQHSLGGIDCLLTYLSPIEALKLSLSLKSCAFKALETMAKGGCDD